MSDMKGADHMYELTGAVFERTFTHEDFPVLTVLLQYPELTGQSTRVTQRINRFYAHMANTLCREAERSLLGMAKRSFARSVALGKPFSEFSVRMTFEREDHEDHEDIDDALIIRRVLTVDLGAEIITREFTDAWDGGGYPLGRRAMRMAA
jgi:hypothetical protein